MATTEKKVKKPARNATHNVAGGPKTLKPAVSKTAKAPKKTPSKKPARTNVRSGGEKSAGDNVVLRIRVRAYESKIIDASVKQIMDTATRYDAVIVGPVPLPTEIKKYTVN